MRKYDRKELYGITRVLEQVPAFSRIHDMSNSQRRKSKKRTLIDFDGDTIDMDSQRYQVFKGNQCCVACGLEAQYFAKEKNKADVKYHFNLYGVKVDGEEVMFTKDHIVPKSLGGENVIANYQTMCYPCNMEKGNKVED